MDDADAEKATICGYLHASLRSRLAISSRLLFDEHREVTDFRIGTEWPLVSMRVKRLRSALPHRPPWGNLGYRCVQRRQAASLARVLTFVKSDGGPQILWSQPLGQFTKLLAVTVVIKQRHYFLPVIG